MSIIKHMRTLAIVVLSSVACSPRDQMNLFMREVDAAPPEKRPPNWEHTKKLMQRTAPPVGQTAPDFSLATVDGKSSLTMSRHRGDRPLVLIFGSFT